MVNKLQFMRTCTHVVATKSQWTQLHKALNAEETLKVLSKDPVDKHDKNMWHGLAILQLMVMEHAPAALDGAWSPLLLKVATCEEVAYSIADLLLIGIEKRNQEQSLRSLLAMNIGYLTPTTIWCLGQDLFKDGKANQHVRLKTSLIVHDL